MKLKESHKAVKKIVLVETPWAWTERDRDSTKLKEDFDLFLEVKKIWIWRIYLATNTGNFLWKRHDDSKGKLQVQRAEPITLKNYS